MRLINLNLLKVSAFLAFIGFMLVYRFFVLEIPNKEIYLFSIYYFFATFCFVFSRIRFSNLINPISLFVPFLYLLSYSFVMLSNEQVEYSDRTMLIINLSIISYVFFASLDYSYIPVKIVHFNNDMRRKLIYFLIIMAFFTFLLECIVFGYVPIFNMFNANIYSDTNDKLIPLLHYFIIINAFIPTWAYIFFKEKIISKKEFRFFLIVSFFILLNFLSKQVYLLSGLCFFIAYIYYNTLNVSMLLKSISVISVLFILTGYLRLDSDLKVSATEFYRAIAGVDNDDVTLTETVFVEYSSKRFTALDEIINYSDEINFLGYGINTFKPLISLFLLEKTGVIQRIPELNSETLAGTLMADPYLDYGLIGVFLLNSFYGYLANRYYNQFRLGYEEAILKFSIIIFCMLMAMFYDYFNSMFVWLGFLMNKFLFGGLNKKTIL